MRSLEQIKNDLAENENSISKIEIRIEKATTEVEKAKQHYSEGLMAELPPDELSPLRDDLAGKQADHDGLVGVRKMIEDTRDRIESEKALILLHDTEVQRFHKSSAAYSDSVSLLETEGKALQDLVGRVSSAINGLFRSLEKSTSSLNWVSRKLPPEYSLESFLAGELVPTENENREALLENLGNDFKGKIGQFEIPEPHLAELGELLGRMEVWRRKVINIPSGVKLVRNTNQLAPAQRSRVKVVDAETLRASREMSKAAA